jgi:hypothetical protein
MYIFIINNVVKSRRLDVCSQTHGDSQLVYMLA